MRTTWRRALTGLVGIGIVTTTAAPARASGLDSVVGVLVVVAAGIVVTDVVFAAHGIGVAAKGELPTSGWSIAETVFTVPQTVASNLVYARVSKDDDDPIQVLALVPTIGVSILSTHGIWGTATTNVNPGVLAGSSIAVGTDIALTTGVLSRAMSGHFSSRPVGITTMLFTGPQVAAAGYLAATEPASSKSGWIALSAWSGALFLHGLVSTIAGHSSSEEGPVEAPPPPPLPRPLLVPANAPPPPPPVPDDRPPLMVPESLRIGPMMVTDGVATAMGVGVSGVLY
ncbi:MAG: hypothetical protein ABJE95_14540 [Byssovorax sp.]